MTFACHFQHSWCDLRSFSLAAAVAAPRWPRSGWGVSRSNWQCSCCVIRWVTHPQLMRHWKELHHYLCNPRSGHLLNTVQLAFYKIKDQRKKFAFNSPPQLSLYLYTSSGSSAAEARSKSPLGESLGGAEEINILPNDGLSICTQGKTMISLKKKQKK